MYKIIYLGTREIVDKEDIVNNIDLSDEHTISFVKETTIDSVVEHFFVHDPIILLIIEEDVEGFVDLVSDIRNDEIFELLPIFLILNNNTVRIRKKYYLKGIDGFLRVKYDRDELIHACNSAVRYRIKLDIVMNQLREVTEKNIEKSIQLDLIKKFIPQTVWVQTEKLAEDQKIYIPEQEMELAIMFADLESFTTITENMTPKDVISMLNGIFDITSQIIYQNNGDIDKFIGDAFLAIFNNPIDAVFSSLMIQEELQGHFSMIRNMEKISKMRIGVHYGKVIRGSVGGTMRYDHTIVGDPINTAQRLESKAPPGGILASKVLLGQCRVFDNKDLPYETYELRGKRSVIEACSLFDYYLENKVIKEELFKLIMENSNYL